MPPRERLPLHRVYPGSPTPSTSPLWASAQGRTITDMKATSLLVLVCAVCFSCSRESSPETSPGSPPEVAPAKVDKPAREVIDSHVHIYPEVTALAQALEVLEGAGIKRFVAKSAGAWGKPKFFATLAMKRVLGDRLEFFCNIDWKSIDDPDFAQKTARGLEKAAQAGAKGVKIFKALGLRVKTADDKLVPVDDSRLDPIFDKCAELGFIVALHTADPVAFFEPVTPQNERYDELKIAEGWSFYGDEFPSHDELLAQRDRRIQRHPKVKFLLIHLANYPENLDYVDKLLDRFPNVWVDTSARVPEFGRHPADKVRALFVKHQDRVLFGSDFISTPYGMQLGSVSEKEPDVKDGIEFFARHWEYFETDHKQMAHPTPIQGNWKVDAVRLPEDVLRKFYVENAEKLIFAPLNPLK